MALERSAAAIEANIDDACKSHPLFARCYSDAALSLLTVLDLEGAQEAAALTFQQQSIRLGHSISAMKHAMNWLAQHSRMKDAPFSAFSTDALQEASHLLREAESYLMVNAAYSWAHRNVIDLAASGQRLRMTFRLPNDDRFEAYDMLIKPTVSPGNTRSRPAPDRLLAEIGRCFARNMVMGGIPTVRNVLSAAFDIAQSLSEPYYQLPLTWSLGEFTIGDFRKVNDAVRAILFGWLFATDLSASYDPSYTRNLPFKIKRVELVNAVKDVTGVAKNVVRHITSLLTYSRGERLSSDPALQPLIALEGDELALSSRLVLGGSPERNLIALINTRPWERALYDRLKDEKESLMRARLESRRPSRYHSWHGKLVGRKDLPNVDYALFDQRTGTVLLAELKWFVAPDETREMADRSEEIQKGVKQCKRLMSAVREDGSLLKHFPDVKDVSCLVVSANSIGMSYVHDDDVPVINEDHFLEELASASDLKEVAGWLRDREYLPKRGRDYRSASPLVSFFSWELEWYGFVPLTDGPFLPLSRRGPTTC